MAAENANNDDDGNEDNKENLEEEEDDDDDEDDDEYIDESLYKLSDSVKEYKGHPDDRRALLAHRQWVAKEEEHLAARLAAKRRHVEKIKREKAAAIKRANEEERRIIMEKEAKRRSKINALKEELLTVPVRTAPLGSDRHHNRYWWFPGERDILYVQRSAQPLADVEFERWGYYAFKDELLQLLHSLDPRGIRESALRDSLKSIYSDLESILHKRPVTKAPDTPAKSHGRQDDLSDLELVDRYANKSRRGKNAITTLPENLYLKQLVQTLMEAWMNRPGKKTSTETQFSKVMMSKVTRARGLDVKTAIGFATEIEAHITVITKEDMKWSEQLEKKAAREENMEDDDMDDSEDGKDEDEEEYGENGNLEALNLKDSAFEPAIGTSSTLWMSAAEQTQWIEQVQAASSSTKVAYLLHAIIGRCSNIRVAPK